jgi:hypothetical protein
MATDSFVFADCPIGKIDFRFLSECDCFYLGGFWVNVYFELNIIFGGSQVKHWGD